MGYNKRNPNQGKNPYRITREPESESTPTNLAKPGVDFDIQRICPSCGVVIKINHNFCKFCGVDLSSIPPLGYSDRTLKELANTALTDPDSGVRKDAVDTLGDLGEAEVLGVFAYILMNDSDELVRKEAADELGDYHHPHSLDILAKALKDKSPVVRKEAIEGLKKIKKKNKPEKIEAEYREKIEEPSEPDELEPKTIEFSESKIDEEEEPEKEEEEVLEEATEEEGEALEEVELDDGN